MKADAVASFSVTTLMALTYHADTRYHLLHLLDVADELFFGLCGSVYMEALTHDALSLLALAEGLPQGFGDEGHEGVQHLQQHVEEVQRGVVGLAVDGLRLSVDIGGLHHLQVPA